MTRLKSTRCPWCFKRHDLVSGIAEKGTKVEPIPEDGDVTFCIGCCMASIFDHSASGGLRFPTKEEADEMEHNALAAKMTMTFAKIPNLPLRPILRRPEWMG